MPLKKNATLSHTERRILIRIIALIGIIAGLWITFAPGSGLVHYNRLKNDLAQLSAKNNELKQQSEELHRQLERLKNDEAYLEELARQKHGLLKKNEMVYEFPAKKKK